MAITRARVTEAEFMRLPDDGRKYELVDGEIREVPAGVRHDIIGITVAALLRPAARGRGFVAGSQAGFRMKSSNIRCPDVSFTLKERFPSGQPPEGFGDVAPDLCVEIISPSEDWRDMIHKVAEYFEAGAQQVWHLFPEFQRVTVYTSPTQAQTYETEDTLTGGDLLPDFRCNVRELFELE